MRFGVFPVSLRKICASTASTACVSSLILLAVFSFLLLFVRFCGILHTSMAPSVVMELCCFWMLGWWFDGPVWSLWPLAACSLFWYFKAGRGTTTPCVQWLCQGKCFILLDPKLIYCRSTKSTFNRHALSFLSRANTVVNVPTQPWLVLAARLCRWYYCFDTIIVHFKTSSFVKKDTASHRCLLDACNNQISPRTSCNCETCI